MADDIKERYTLISRLGEGGAGMVWLAKDRHLSRFAAIKMASRDDPEAVEALERERDILLRIRHTRIPQLYDYVEGEDTCYLVQELVEGRSLSQVQENQEYSAQNLMDWFWQLAWILEYLQEECVPPVVHGDLKPSNLILDRKGRIHLIDFGTAGVPGCHCTQGTAGFAAPEQYTTYGGRLSFSTDIYGAGATFLVLSQKMDLGFGFSLVLHKCMHSNPEKRWKTVKSMKKTLKTCMFIHAKKV